MTVLSTDPADQEGQPAALAQPSPAVRRWTLFLLMLTMTLSFVDRQVINILAEHIKQDLGLDDWQIGLLTGLAFAVVYTGLAVPVAWLAARVSRPAIIAGAVAIWSGFTFLSGFAQSFAHLMIARLGVGAGEAGGVSPGHSLISDQTPREKRASALAFFHLGIPLGTLAGLAVGGLLLDQVGWRGAFMIAGAPGVIVALLVLFTIREPRPPRSQSTPVGPSIGETFRLLLAKRSFWCMGVGGSLKGFVAYAHVPFTAAFFFRIHGEALNGLAAPLGLQAAGLLGITFGLITGLGGAIGTWGGGVLADRLGRSDQRAFGAIPALSTLAALPFMIAAYLASSPVLALVLLIPPAVLNATWFGPVHVTGQSVVPATMRANSSAILLIVLNVIGLGLGPLLVGLLSDGLSSGMGLGDAEGVRWALILSSFIALPTAWLFWAARKTIRQDIIS